VGVVGSPLINEMLENCNVFNITRGGVELMIGQYLEKLEHLVDLEHVRRSEELQRASAAYEPVDRIPLILGSADDMSKIRFPFSDWPIFEYGEVFKDPEKMLLDELLTVYEGTLIKDDKVYVIRANYGVGIIPSLFGCEIIQSGNDLPWVKPMDSLDDIKKIVKKGVPDVNTGMVSTINETQDFFRSKLRDYPNLRKSVHIGMVDNQGPFNIAVSMRGPDLFVELYDHKALIKDFLELITQTYIEFSRNQKKRTDEEMNIGYYFQYRLSSGVKISEDHALSISPQMYDEFCLPFNARIGEEFGGMSILLCGQTKHIIKDIIETPHLKGIIYWSENFDDLVYAYQLAKDKKICLMWYGGIPRNRRKEFPTGIILKEQVRSIDEALRIREEYARSR